MKAFFIRSSRTVYVSSVLTWGRHMNVIRWFHCNPKSGRLSTHAQQLSHKLSILNADYCCPHLKIVKKKKKRWRRKKRTASDHSSQACQVVYLPDVFDNFAGDPFRFLVDVCPFLGVCRVFIS